MVYVTHDQVEAMTLADKIVVIDSGSVEQVGSPKDLYNFPINKFVAGFIGAPQMNFVDTEIVDVREGGMSVKMAADRKLTIPVTARRASAGDKVCLGVRPDDLPVGRPDADFTMQSLVYHTEYLGGVTYVYVEVEDAGGQAPKLVVSAPGTSWIEVGERIPVGIRASECHLFDSDGVAFERTRLGSGATCASRS